MRWRYTAYPWIKNQAWNDIFHVNGEAWAPARLQRSVTNFPGNGRAQPGRDISRGFPASTFLLFSIRNVADFSLFFLSFNKKSKQYFLNNSFWLNWESMVIHAVGKLFSLFDEFDPEMLFHWKKTIL